MKEILMMIQGSCPYCKLADRMISELTEEEPTYAAIPIRRVDELREPEFADTLDYWYVPTFYVDGEKLLEGVPTLEKVRTVLERARE